MLTSGCHSLRVWCGRAIANGEYIRIFHVLQRVLVDIDKASGVHQITSSL